MVDLRKTSSYKQDKSAKWQKANSSQGQDGQPTSSGGQTSNCTNCGRKSHPKDQCPAKDKECMKCGRKGHFQAVCRGGGRGRSRSRGRGQQNNHTEGSEPGVKSGRVSVDRGRSQSTHVSEVRCGRVAARRAVDDSEPTPLMEDVVIKPTGQGTSRTGIEQVPGTHT